MTGKGPNKIFSLRFWQIHWKTQGGRGEATAHPLPLQGSVILEIRMGALASLAGSDGRLSPRSRLG